jgi:hypothetical protein
LGTEESRKANLTVEEIHKVVLKNADKLNAWYKKDRECLDSSLRIASDDKEKFTFTMLVSILQDLEMNTLMGTQNTLLLLELLKSEVSQPNIAKLVEQMQQDLTKIREEHDPVVNAIKQAIDMRNKVLRDNQ